MALSETLCGEPCASSVMVNVAVRWPGPIGMNATKIVQFAAGATAAVQLLVKLKSEGLGPGDRPRRKCGEAHSPSW